jgi:uncharacterized protein
MSTLRFFGLGAVALAIVCAATPAAAQNSAPATAPSASPQAQLAARELVGLVSSSILSEFTNKLTAEVWPGIEAELHGQNPNVDSATLAALRAEFERLIVDNMAAVIVDMPTVYERYFTADELRDLVAFYRTPLGAKVLRTLPQATTDMFALMAPRMQGLQERVHLSFLNILQKRGLYAR